MVDQDKEFASLPIEERLTRMVADDLKWLGGNLVPEDPPPENGNGHKPKKTKKRKRAEKSARSESADEQPTKGLTTDAEQNAIKPDVHDGAMPTREDFDTLVRRSKLGDKQSTTKLRAILAENPVIWQQAGDLAAHAELSLLRVISKGRALEGGLIKRYADDLTQQLAGSAPTPLEKLAARRVVQCWLWVQYVDMIVAANTDMPLPQAKYWAGRQDAAHRRWMSSMKMLTAMRALLPAAGTGSTPSREITSDAEQPTTREANANGKPATTPDWDQTEPLSTPTNRINGNGRHFAGDVIPARVSVGVGAGEDLGGVLG